MPDGALLGGVACLFGWREEVFRWPKGDDFTAAARLAAYADCFPCGFPRDDRRLALWRTSFSSSQLLSSSDSELSSSLLLPLLLLWDVVLLLR